MTSLEVKPAESVLLETIAYNDDALKLHCESLREDKSQLAIINHSISFVILEDS